VPTLSSKRSASRTILVRSGIDEGMNIVYILTGNMKDQNKAYLFALSAVLAWSTVATAFKIGLRYLNFIELLFYSALASLLVLAAAMALLGHFRVIRTFRRGGLAASALLGLLNPFGYYLILLKAYALIPAQVAQPLNYTWAVVIVVFSVIFLKQRITLTGIAAILVSYFGVFIISTQGNLRGFGSAHPPGIFLALASSVIWASFWLLNARDRRDAVIKLFLNFLFGTLYALGALLIFTRLHAPDIRGIAAAVYIGIFEMGLTFIFWLQALKFSRTTAQVSNLILLSPFLSLILINFVLGEKIIWSTIIGLVLIVAGIALQQFRGLKSQ
jgi:drug/metabolite transporter (DMT)-like permease